MNKTLSKETYEKLIKIIKEDSRYSEQEKTNMLKALDSLYTFNIELKDDQLLNQVIQDGKEFLNDDSISCADFLMKQYGINPDATKEEIDKIFREQIDTIHNFINKSETLDLNEKYKEMLDALNEDYKVITEQLINGKEEIDTKDPSYIQAKQDALNEFNQFSDDVFGIERPVKTEEVKEEVKPANEEIVQPVIKVEPTKVEEVKEEPKVNEKYKGWDPRLTEEQILDAYSRDIYEPVGIEYEMFLSDLGLKPLKKEEAPVEEVKEEVRPYQNLTEEEIKKRIDNLWNMAITSGEFEDNDPQVIEYHALLDELNKRKGVAPKAAEPQNPYKDLSDEEIKRRIDGLWNRAINSGEFQADDEEVKEYHGLLGELRRRRGETVKTVTPVKEEPKPVVAPKEEVVETPTAIPQVNKKHKDLFRNKLMIVKSLTNQYFTHLKINLTTLRNVFDDCLNDNIDLTDREKDEFAIFYKNRNKIANQTQNRLFGILPQSQIKTLAVDIKKDAEDIVAKFTPIRLALNKAGKKRYTSYGYDEEGKPKFTDEYRLKTTDVDRDSLDNTLDKFIINIKNSIGLAYEEDRIKQTSIEVKMNGKSFLVPYRFFGGSVDRKMRENHMLDVPQVEVSEPEVTTPEVTKEVVTEEPRLVNKLTLTPEINNTEVEEESRVVSSRPVADEIINETVEEVKDEIVNELPVESINETTELDKIDDESEIVNVNENVSDEELKNDDTKEEVEETSQEYNQAFVSTPVVEETTDEDIKVTELPEETTNEVVEDIQEPVKLDDKDVEIFGGIPREIDDSTGNLNDRPEFEDAGVAGDFSEITEDKPVVTDTPVESNSSTNNLNEELDIDNIEDEEKYTRDLLKQIDEKLKNGGTYSVVNAHKAEVTEDKPVEEVVNEDLPSVTPVSEVTLNNEPVDSNIPTETAIQPIEDNLDAKTVILSHLSNETPVTETVVEDISDTKPDTTSEDTVSEEVEEEQNTSDGEYVIAADKTELGLRETVKVVGKRRPIPAELAAGIIGGGLSIFGLVSVVQQPTIPTATALVAGVGTLTALGLSSINNIRRAARKHKLKKIAAAYTCNLFFGRNKIRMLTFDGKEPSVQLRGNMQKEIDAFMEGKYNSNIPLVTSNNLEHAFLLDDSGKGFYYVTKKEEKAYNEHFADKDEEDEFISFHDIRGGKDILIDSYDNITDPIYKFIDILKNGTGDIPSLELKENKQIKHDKNDGESDTFLLLNDDEVKILNQILNNENFIKKYGRYTYTVGSGIRSLDDPEFYIYCGKRDNDEELEDTDNKTDEEMAQELLNEVGEIQELLSGEHKKL